MDIQRINVKLLAQAPAGFRLDPFLAIFGRWRHEESPEVWVDLADYAHMAQGQGIAIIGKRGNFAVDETPPGIGLLYAGKKGFEGATEDRIVEAFRRCLALTAALTEAPEYPSELELKPARWELVFNDRLDTPNTDETDDGLRPAISAALDKLFGAGNYELRREADPQRRYGYSITAADWVAAEDLLQRAAR